MHLLITGTNLILNRGLFIQHLFEKCDENDGPSTCDKIVNSIRFLVHIGCWVTVVVMYYGND